MPTDLTSSQENERPVNKANRVRDMTARLFAELFYKQVMAEREQKRRRTSDEAFDKRDKVGLQ